MKFFFKRILPAPEKLIANRLLHWLLKKIGNAYIWQVNRRSIAGGFATGLFFGCLPIPIQIPCAVAAAVFMRFNVPIAAFSTLFSNPFTMPMIFYGNYQVGCWFLGGHEGLSEWHFTVANLKQLGGQILIPLFTGSVLVGTLLASIGYCVIYYLWQWKLVQVLSKRKNWHAKLRLHRAQRRKKPVSHKH